MTKTLEQISASAFLLFIRVYWGIQFFQAGLGKSKNIEGPIKFFTSLDIPFPVLSAYLVTGAELVGGLLLIAGILSRPVAAILSVTMLGAYYFAHAEALHSIFSDQGAFIDAHAFSFLFASLTVLVFGAGSFSVDVLFKKYWNSRNQGGASKK